MIRLATLQLCMLVLILGVRPADADEPLDIVIFGATGTLGSEMVREALERGHHVFAVSRRPDSIEAEHSRLTPIKGDLLDRDSVAAIVADKDVVIVSVRGVIGDSGEPTSALQYRAAETLVDALYPLGDDGPQLLHIGGSGSLEIRPGVLFGNALPRFALSKGLKIEIDGQILALEFFRKVDDVRWTYVTPPRYFTKGPRTGVYRIGGDRALVDENGRTKVSRKDFAVAVIDEAERNAHERERISIAY